MIIRNEVVQIMNNGEQINMHPTEEEKILIDEFEELREAYLEERDKLRDKYFDRFQQVLAEIRDVRSNEQKK